MLIAELNLRDTIKTCWCRSGCKNDRAGILFGRWPAFGKPVVATEPLCTVCWMDMHERFTDAEMATLFLTGRRSR